MTRTGLNRVVAFLVVFSFFSHVALANGGDPNERKSFVWGSSPPDTKVVVLQIILGMDEDEGWRGFMIENPPPWRQQVLDPSFDSDIDEEFDDEEDE